MTRASAPDDLDHAARGDDYDRLPYPSLPFADTQPARLAALAILFGAAPADVAQARVLELGCAAGGNIVPLAMRFPAARFCGIDLSQRHIDQGTARIAALGLRNIELLQADLDDVDFSADQFDYIVCNGVYSWVPDATRAAILRLCRQALAPNGVATISYNVLPGWHQRMIIRDLCRRHAGPDGSPKDRVAKARAALNRLAAAASADTPYGALLRIEAKRLCAVPDAYVMGEFLARDNTPLFFREFAARADEAGLRYLCEADLRAAVPPDLAPSLPRFGINHLAAEQEIDELTGRPFRRSILVRSDALPSTMPLPAIDKLHALHLSSPLRADPARSTAGAAVFTDDRGRPVTAKLPALARVLDRLAAAYPATVPVADLVSLAPDAATRSRLSRAVLDIVLAGRASLWSAPLRVGRAADERPVIWPFARLEAACGQPWLTSLRHDAVPTSPAAKALFPLLDARHERVALQAIVSAGASDGSVPPGSPPDRDAAEAMLRSLLTRFERHALLQPGDDA